MYVMIPDIVTNFGLSVLLYDHRNYLEQYYENSPPQKEIRES